MRVAALDAHPRDIERGLLILAGIALACGALGWALGR